MSLAPHTRVGPYEIAAQIGAGGMGEVYRARDMRLGREADCAAIETELEDRRSRGEYISRACDVVIATGRNDVVGLRRALRASVADDTSWFTARLGPGPGLEVFRADPEVDTLLETLYDGARPAGGILPEPAW